MALNLENIIAVIGAAFMFIAFFTKSDKTQPILLSIGIFLLGTHFFLLEAYAAAIAYFTGFIRSILMIFFRNKKLALIFAIIAPFPILFFWDGHMSIYVFFAQAFTNYIFLAYKGSTLRFMTIAQSIPWLIHHIIVGSSVMTMIEVIIIFINLYVGFRILKNEKIISFSKISS